MAKVGEKRDKDLKELSPQEGVMTSKLNEPLLPDPNANPKRIAVGWGSSSSGNVRGGWGSSNG